MRWKRSATGCASVAILLLSLPLTACNSVSSGAAESQLPPRPLILSQPPVLRLPAGKPVETADGLYTPATAETWHSDARMRAAEQAASDAATALQIERSRPR
jgi:hypothetical protein